MKLASDLWLEGSYYIDFDRHGQLRIVGPNNHLQFGTVGLYKDQIDINSIEPHGDEVRITGSFRSPELFFHDPAMGHMRKLRRFIELPGKPVPTLAEVAKKHPGELAPNYLGVLSKVGGYEITYKRLYRNHWYGVTLLLAPGVSVHRHEKRRGFNLATKSEQIEFMLTTMADNKPKSTLQQIVKHLDLAKEFGTRSAGLQHLLDRSAIEIEHLVRNNKTSGVEYGTIFPRDWMEAADLGVGDLTTESIEYMYHKAFEHINEGEGWHENSVGEFKFEQEAELGSVETDLDDLIDRSSDISQALKDMVDQLHRLYIDRNMIDIEPHYILGLMQLSPKQIAAADVARVRDAAAYILRQAKKHDLITFKKVPGVFRRHRDEEYAESGNWRDSGGAFKMVHPVIAPYDVNVVFYPQALRQIRQHAKWFGVDAKEVDALIAKWDGIKSWYRFTNSDGSAAYALALYDIRELQPGLKYRRLEVNHLDEAYELFYGQPAEADVISFCDRLLSPDYFYTPSGPLLVGAHDGYSTADYHGKVIWAKQTAFVVAGLARQIASAGFKTATKKLMHRALVATAKASIEAFSKLDAIPELYYDLKGTPHFFNDQTNAMGPMNMVQLWSAVGARRIIRTYLENASG